MRRLGLVLCVLLAFVVPAMAVDWYAIPSSGASADLASYRGYDYNPDPLQTAIDNWWNNIYVEPYDAGIAYGDAPWYEPNNVPAITNGPDVDFVFDLSAYEIRHYETTNLFQVGGYCDVGNIAPADTSIGTLCIGDRVWPLGDSPTLWTYQAMMQGALAGGYVQIGKVVCGHDQSEFELPDVCNNLKWEMRPHYSQEDLSIGEWHVVSPQMIVTDGLRPEGFGINYFQLTTGSAHDQFPVSVTIGDIYLNQHPSFFDMACETWNITGTVGLEPGALDGNALFLLKGDVNSYTETPASDVAVLNIQESVLDQIIADGYFWIVGGSRTLLQFNQGYNVTHRTRAADINVMDPSDNGGKFIPNYYQTYRQITPATKDHWLKINDNGDGTVNVHVVGYHYQNQYKEYAWSPNYPNGAWGVEDPNIVLEWSAGDGADSHHVYFAKALRSDLNKSGTVDIEDFSILVDHWLTGGSSYTDPNGYALNPYAPNAANIAEPNNICNLADFAVMAEEWGQDYLEFQGTTTGAVTSLQPTTVALPLEINVTYIWRVDEYDADTDTTYTGRVWNFRLNEYYPTLILK